MGGVGGGNDLYDVEAARGCRGTCTLEDSLMVRRGGGIPGARCGTTFLRSGSCLESSSCTAFASSISASRRALLTALVDAIALASDALRAYSSGSCSGAMAEISLWTAFGSFCGKGSGGTAFCERRQHGFGWPRRRGHEPDHWR